MYTTCVKLTEPLIENRTASLVVVRAAALLLKRRSCCTDSYNKTREYRDCLFNTYATQVSTIT